jgi:hypothetical protein
VVASADGRGSPSARSSAAAAGRNDAACRCRYLRSVSHFAPAWPIRSVAGQLGRDVLELASPDSTLDLGPSVHAVAQFPVSGGAPTSRSSRRASRSFQSLLLLLQGFWSTASSIGATRSRRRRTPSSSRRSRRLRLHLFAIACAGRARLLRTLVDSQGHALCLLWRRRSSSQVRRMGRAGKTGWRVAGDPRGLDRLRLLSFTWTCATRASSTLAILADASHASWAEAC